jgi:hypothetical protein
MEFGLGVKGQLMVPCGVGVGLTCSALWSGMGVYVKEQSRVYDAVRNVDSNTNGNSLGMFNGYSCANPAPACSLCRTAASLRSLCKRSCCTRRRRRSAGGNAERDALSFDRDAEAWAQT